MSKPDHKYIFLQPKEDYDPNEGRMWCEDDVWSSPDSEHHSTMYIRNDIHVSKVAALNAEIAKLREDLAEAVGALETIADEMIFPNQLESGFAHGKPTFADMQARVDFARATASHALAKIGE